MGVLLDEREDSMSDSDNSRYEIRDLTCIWNIRIVNGKPCDFRGFAAIERITGYRAGKFSEKDVFRWPNGLWFQIIHPEDRDSYREAWSRLERGKDFQIDSRIIRANGETRWIETRAMPMGSPGDLRFAGVITDITERRAAEDEQARVQAAIHKASLEWRLMFDAVDSPLMILDSAGRIIRMNHAAKTLSGNSYADNLGQTLDRIRFAEPWSTAATQVALAFHSRASGSCEVNTEATDETWEITTNLFTGSGVGDRVILALRNVTEHKRSEEALREADRRAIVQYEKLLDRLASLAQKFSTVRDITEIYRALRDFALVSTPGSSICVSYAEHGVRTPVYASCEGREIDLTEKLAVNMRDSSPHARALATSKVVITDDFQKATAREEIVPMGFDASPGIPRSSLVAPMSVMGRIIGSVEVQAMQPSAFDQEHATAMRMAANLAAVAIENTRLFEREREREEQLRQSQKMEAVGRLAGGVAHDFNNLLTAIIGYSQLIHARLDRTSPLRHDVEEIQKASQRASALTSQLLAFSRKQVIQPKVLDLNLVIANLEKMLRRLIGEDVELTTRFDQNPVFAKADPGQIEQVIMNLAINSRDAMPQGGKLIIETSNVILDEVYASKRGPGVKPGPHVCLTVTDTGCGMDKEVQSHIFEPFFTTKEQSKGTGLGLSTVYAIVNQNGGDIRVDTRPGKGASFKIYLPRVDSPSEETITNKARKELRSECETILLVEDEDVVRSLVREILNMQGYNVLEAANGVKALPVCEKHEGQIHLMLTDVVMPQMGGRELAERVARLRPATKVLFMSGYTDDAIVHHGVLDAGISFIQKPFAPDVLARKVREILDAPAKEAERDSSSNANLSQSALDDSLDDTFDTIH